MEETSIRKSNTLDSPPTSSTSTATSTSSCASSSRRFLPPHILVLVHGNNGSPSDFLMMERVFYEKFGVSHKRQQQQDTVAAESSSATTSPASASEQSIEDLADAAAFQLFGPPKDDNSGKRQEDETAQDVAASATIIGPDFQSKHVLVLRSSANHGKTSLGIEIGGRKLAQEIADTLLGFERNPKVRQHKLSIVAHSLGGLYARYALVQLMALLDETELNMEYTSFVTLCTPHLGVRKPRSNSKLGSMWRFGCHKVLSTRYLYGRTGVDLLGEVPNDAVNYVEKPVLEYMTEPDSLFLSCLRRFRFCTLVALTDGDLLVPYPTGAIVNRNPYPNHLIKGQFVEWKWTVRHFGFDKSSERIRKQLENKVDYTVDCGDPEELVKRFLLLDEDRVLSEDGTDCDNKMQLEFSIEAARNLNTVPWRRIDLSVHVESVLGLTRLHDWPISKNQIGDCKANEFLSLMCDILGDDFQLPAPN